MSDSDSKSTHLCDQPTFDQDLGYPQKQGYPHYGLYQPILDCFLLITDNKQQSIDLKTLLITKYSLFIIQLDQAKNYSFNIIDNDCCEAWSVELEKKFDFATVNYSKPLMANLLIPADKNNKFNLDIFKEKLWCQYVWHWIRFIEWVYEFDDHWYHQKRIITKIHSNMFPDYNNYIHKIDEHVAFIYNILITVNDINDNWDKITRYFSKNLDIHDLYQIWKKQC
jgi:hypothetical protein